MENPAIFASLSIWLAISTASSFTLGILADRLYLHFTRKLSLNRNKEPSPSPPQTQT